MRQAALLLALVAGCVGAAVGGFPDLHVYRYGGKSVLDRWPVYGSDDPVTGYPFTYPPIATVLFVPLAVVPGWVAAAGWTAAGAACLAATVVVVRREQGRPTPGLLLVVVCVAALGTEPVWQNLSFGQVNLLVMAAVLTDLLGRERRWSGVLVGLVAAVKLTPLVFVVLLVLVGRRVAAARALAVFAAAAGVGLLAVPGASTYWTDQLLDPTRVGPPALAHNQAVTGALTRLLDGPPDTWLWIAVAGPVAAGVLVVAAGWWRRGDRALAACLGAVAMLLASPVSWSHHWVWAVPVALVLWERSRWAAAGWALVFVARPVLWPPWGEGRELDWSPVEHVLGNGYSLAALALAGWAAFALVRGREQEPETALRRTP